MRMRLQPDTSQITVTTVDVMRKLNVSHLTVLNWRKGSSERRPLPVIYSRAGKARRIKIADADLREYLAAYRPDLLNVWQHQQSNSPWTQY